MRDAFLKFEESLNSEKNKHVGLYSGIFNDLANSLSDLGKEENNKVSSIELDKRLKELFNIVRDIPIDNKQNYDILGFVYEYLISRFAENAGKKSGEFYTPHEVSILMSEIVHENLKDVKKPNESIKVYDPTSGSGSLLLTIGDALQRTFNKKLISYYAQDIKVEAYNLTRMNLIMRGISKRKIEVRKADTLTSDWPLDGPETNKPLRVDAVVSNPPYSIHWEPKQGDMRFTEFGLAPKTKADYAFLLHDLHHINTEGVVTIVLPHGVLFRGGAEEKIRTKLVEGKHIEAVIGLPSNIFYGTEISTIIMILKNSNSKNNDGNILFIDAKDFYIKEGKKHKLRSSDIKRIIDVYKEFKKNRNISGDFYRAVDRKEIIENKYNLNISRYVNTTESSDHQDIYAIINGGIPNTELNKWNNVWELFSSLKKELFKETKKGYYDLNNNDIFDLISKNKEVNEYKLNEKTTIQNLSNVLKTELIDKLDEQLKTKKNDSVDSFSLDILKDKVYEKINVIIKNSKFIEKYEAYQTFDDNWNFISNDMMSILSDGFVRAAIFDVNINEIKTNENTDDNDSIISLDLIKKRFFSEKYNQWLALNESSKEYSERINEIYESFSEEEKSDNANYFTKELKRIDSKKLTKEVIEEFNSIAEEDSDSFEAKVLEIQKLSTELKDQIDTKKKKLEKELNSESLVIAKSLTEEQVKELLVDKWINPIVDSLVGLVDKFFENLSYDLVSLNEKYSNNLIDIQKQINEIQSELVELLDQLTTSDKNDEKAIEDLKNLLKNSN
ncbi:type I restriction-modification system subunit M [Mycoplasma sp. K3]|nr:type I restriction-modification system subunit M [Mycoplasma bradburyae]MDC4184201.1 type I restriction-modification system subunit M [Mycoplasma bradburyae]